MSSRMSLSTGTEQGDEREARLQQFILESLQGLTAGHPQSIAVLANSPASPVIRAILALSDKLAARGHGASIILAGGAIANENETWNLVFSSDFTHEIRLTTNPRVLDGHEQLVVGDRAVWFGDCMRRSPTKRDAFEKFIADQPGEAKSARSTFNRLRELAEPVYASSTVASVTVAKVTSEVPVTGNEACDHQGNEFPHDATSFSAANDIVATLTAWRPLTRH